MTFAAKMVCICIEDKVSEFFHAANYIRSSAMRTIERDLALVARAFTCFAVAIKAIKADSNKQLRVTTASTF